MDSWKPVGRTIIKDNEVVASGVTETHESLKRNDDCSRRFIIWRTSDYWMDWEVHESTGRKVDGPILFGELHDSSYAPRPESVLFEGMLKWDKCCQWNEGARGMHYDSLDSVPDLRSIIAQLHEIAAEHMEAWNS